MASVLDPGDAFAKEFGRLAYVIVFIHSVVGVVVLILLRPKKCGGSRWLARLLRRNARRPPPIPDFLGYVLPYFGGSVGIQRMDC